MDLQSATRKNRHHLVIALVSVVGVAALAIFVRKRRHGARPRHVRTVRRVVTVRRSPMVVYAYWRNLELLPTFVKHLEAVHDLGGRRSHWIARSPTGRTIEWDAEIIEDLPGQRLSWRSMAGAHVNGSITFSPVSGGRGTEVAVEMQLGAGDPVSSSLARLFAGPEVLGDLHRFKRLVEVDDLARPF